MFPTGRAFCLQATQKKGRIMGLGLGGPPTEKTCLGRWSWIKRHQVKFKKMFLSFNRVNPCLDPRALSQDLVVSRE